MTYNESAIVSYKFEETGARSQPTEGATSSTAAVKERAVKERKGKEMGLLCEMGREMPLCQGEAL
jgi:hypothetical protein